MSKVQVVLVEWMGYPLFRKKQIGSRFINCGLGKLLKNIQKYDAGIDFECSVIINQHSLPAVNPLIATLNRVPQFRPLLINNVATNSCEKYQYLFKQYPFIQRTFFRENINQDIGAYDFFIDYLRQQGHRGDVLFVNSSVRGPETDGWLLKYKRLFEAEPDIGLCGISINSHITHSDNSFSPHVQSFFLYTSMDVLDRVFPHGFLSRATDLGKVGLIEQGEINISQQVLKAGLGIRSSTFPEFIYRWGQPWTLPEGDIRFQEEYSRWANQC